MAQHTANTFEELVSRPLAALKVGRAFGKQYYSVPVRILFNNSRQCRTEAVKIVWVKARNATEAANYVRDEYECRAETEITAYGPKGGEIHRFIGWESSVAGRMLRGHPPTSLRLDLGCEA